MGGTLSLKNTMHIEVADKQVTFIKQTKDGIDTLIVDNVLNKTDEISSFIKKHTNILTRTNIFVSSSNVLIKQTTVPKMGKSDLWNYVHNNIDSFFTIDADKYSFTSKVINSYKTEGKWKQDVLLYAIPKALIGDIKALANIHRLRINRIESYPEVLFRKIWKNGNSAIVEIGSDRIDFVSVNNETFFMFASDFIDANLDVESRVGLIYSTVKGYLDFFSIRHFGEKIDKLYLSSCKGEEEVLPLENLLHEYSPIISRNDQVSSVDRLNIFNSIKGKSDETFKKLFILDAPKPKKYNYQAIAGGIAVLLVVIAFLFPFVQGYMIDAKIESLNNELFALHKVLELYDQEAAIKRTISSKKDMISKANDINIDHIELMNTIKAGIPKDVVINSIKADTSYRVDLVFTTYTTGDTTELIASLRAMDLFENIPVHSVNINDKEQQIAFGLNIKPEKRTKFIMQRKWSHE